MSGGDTWTSGRAGPLQGEIRVPGDKSISHRAVMFAALAEGVSSVSGFLEGEDTRATARAFAAMGVRVEQPVDITIDSYPDIHWQGTVESLGAATGAEFSVLPPQNATGNWIKVVQRVPIRIRLKPNEQEHVLRAGMSATVEIDTRANAIQG